MKRKLLLGVLTFAMTFLLAGCKEDVESGEIVKCKHCSKEISNNVRILKVYPWYADEYNVKTKHIYCDKCGNENITYKVSKRCKKCRDVYSSYTRSAKRHTEPHNQTITEPDKHHPQVD